MLALANLSNPFANFTHYKAHKLPRKTMIQSSVRAPHMSLRRKKRNNYLRPKIIRTLTKTHSNIPLEEITKEEGTLEEITMEEASNEFGFGQEQAVRDLETQNLMGTLEEGSIESDFGQEQVVRDLETQNLMDTLEEDSNESGFRQEQVVRDLETQNLIGTLEQGSTEYGFGQEQVVRDLETQNLTGTLEEDSNEFGFRQEQVLRDLETQNLMGTLEEGSNESSFRQEQVLRDLETQNLMGTSAEGSNESGFRQEQVVRDLETQNPMGDGLSGHTVFKIIGSFVGLFVLQTIVTVCMMAYGKSDEKDDTLVIGDQNRDIKLVEVDQEGVLGIDGDVSTRTLAGLNKDESEFEAKISEIRKMAWEVREAEERKKVENGEAHSVDASDEEEEGEDEDFEGDNSRINSGIVKEVDGRLTKLRKSYPSPLMNVNMMNGLGGLGKEGKAEGLDGNEEDKMLLFKMKNKFRSHLTTSKDKPKGFGSNDGVRGKDSNSDGKKPVERSGGGSNVDEISSTPLKGTSKISGSSGVNGSTGLGREVTENKLEKAMSEGAKPETGHSQDSSDGNILDEVTGIKDPIFTSTQDETKINGHVASTSEMQPTPRRKGKPDSNGLGSKLPLEIVDHWWSKLPYVLVILMQKGTGDEAERGFYNLRINTNAENQSYSIYTVAFEDLTDAKNFSYLLEFAFVDQPDAAVEVAPLSTKDFQEVIESLDTEVIVLRKGELKLYAGQPLADIEAALRSLVKLK
ncbi:unnamed protein product [Amaranthus hypochondriacus]